MGSLGPTELIIIFFIILLLFGAKKLPDLARGLGKGIREFQDASKEITDEIKNASDYDSSSRRSQSRPSSGPQHQAPEPEESNEAAQADEAEEQAEDTEEEKA
jgi:sec-independent protein translocase protein TatA